MGQGHIRKGFFFYFGLFVLLLVAIFCICLVIMMFNPGKTVLWMQYFTANEHFVVGQTTDDQQIEIDMDYIQNNIDTIEINCSSYAEVLIQRNKDNNFNEEGIHIINNAKGFQGAKGAVHFDYDVTVVGKTLTLSVTEPNGFLHFSKDIKIVLASYTEWENNFGHINLIVNTASGNVSVGNSGMLPEDVELAGLTVNTKKGNVILGDYFNTEKLSKLSLSTVSGDIISHNKIEYNQKDYTGIKTNCETGLSTESGEIDVGMVAVENNNLDLTCYTGSVNVEFLKALKTDVVCKRGDFVLGTVEGDLNYAGAASDTMITPFITIDYINGNFALVGGEKAEVNISIKKIDGKLHLLADKGKLNVKEAGGEIEVVSNANLTADIIVAENNDELIEISSNSGKIEISFLGQFKNATVSTNTGNVVVNVVSGTKFEANTFKNIDGVESSDQDPLDVGKISVSVELLKGEYERNSFVVDSKDGSLNIYTNAKVSYNLVSKSDLVA